MATFWVFLFCAFLCLTLLAAGLGFRFMESQQKREAGRILRTASPGNMEPKIRIFINPGPRQLGRKDGIFRIRPIRSLQDRVYASGLTWRVEALLAAMLLLAAAGALLGWRFHLLIYPDLSSIALALLLPILPVLYVNHKRRARLGEFEKQFPEALDFIARSIQAGHALSVSLELLATESSEPLRSEFRRVFHELNLGSDFDTALKNLAQRVPLIDIRFFVSAVLLQRETGGNLSEMLTKLAYIIRERFRIKGQVRASAAHGKITATVLTVMPFALAFGLSIVSPGYLPGMAHDPTGKKLIIAALAAQLLGFYFLRKIVDIEV